MMQSLQGRLGVVDLDAVATAVKIRFADPTAFKTAESLILHEQQMIDDDELLGMCQNEYSVTLEVPRYFYIPREMARPLEGQGVVPIRYDAAENKMYVGILPEWVDRRVELRNMEVVKIVVPLYYYVDLYTTYFRTPEFLFDLPVLDKLSFIYNEAIQLRASDITICNLATHVEISYNVRKTKRFSRRRLAQQDVYEIVKLLADKASASLGEEDGLPRYFSVDVDEHNRGRVVINSTYYGKAITIRVLPNEYLSTTLEDLNLDAQTCEFIREYVLSPEKGLRVWIGETMSGKNTSILSALLELAGTNKYKIVSIENPVEMIVPGIIQIPSDSEESFQKNADSLLRQNPDIVYLTEITEKTAESILKQANTSKAVYTTVHANGISSVFSRLIDLIPGMDIDRLIETVQSCVYQVLVRDESTDTVRPVTRCVHFDEDFKEQLFGQPRWKIRQLVKEREDEWCSNTTPM